MVFPGDDTGHTAAQQRDDDAADCCSDSGVRQSVPVPAERHRQTDDQQGAQDQGIPGQAEEKLVARVKVRRQGFSPGIPVSSLPSLVNGSANKIKLK